MEIFFICMKQSLYYAHWILFTILPYALLRPSILHIIVVYTVYQVGLHFQFVDSITGLFLFIRQW